MSRRKTQRPKTAKNKKRRGDISRRKQRIRALRKDWNHGEQYNGVERP